jgi:hypothetical protein
MSLPPLTHWTDTRIGLHQAAQVIGGVRAASAPPEPNYTHLGLRVIPHGLTTGILPIGAELVLDFTQQTLVIESAGQRTAEITLAGHTQTSLADEVEKRLAALGQPVTLQRNKITGQNALAIDAQQAADYAQVLHLVAESLRRVRDRLPGQKTPVVVWPHGFDLSCLWFATETALEEAPHMAFGFSPYSTGLERPYLYTYLYPVPDKLTEHAVPPFTRWQTTGWTGTITEYDGWRTLDNPQVGIELAWNVLFRTLSPLLRT